METLSDEGQQHLTYVEAKDSNEYPAPPAIMVSDPANEQEGDDNLVVNHSAAEYGEEDENFKNFKTKSVQEEVLGASKGMYTA